MTPQQVISPLIQQLDLLIQVLHESPYISREQRIGIEKEIKALSELLQEGEMTFPQGEKAVTALNKRAAVDEITSLLNKIYHLNPSSPRLETLRALEKKLKSEEISPEQARRSMQDLMQG